jgi:hypothetical protein
MDYMSFTTQNDQNPFCDILNIITILGFVGKKFWCHSPPPYVHVSILHLYMIHQCIIHIVHINEPILQGFNQCCPIITF